MMFDAKDSAAAFCAYKTSSLNIKQIQLYLQVVDPVILSGEQVTQSLPGRNINATNVITAISTGCWCCCCRSW